MTADDRSFALPDPGIIASLESSVDDRTEQQLRDLESLVRIPSISWPSFDARHVSDSAAAVAELLESTGLFDAVRIERAPLPGSEELGNPAVLATRAARAGRPTLLLYAHHDVQPIGREEDWETAPFEPTIREGRMYARGAADDKAGIMAHVGALRAIGDVIGDDLDIGLVVFVEGEEEYGSPSFGAFLEMHADTLRSDVIIVADSGNWDEDTPALTVSLRGNVTMTVSVRTLEHASHSGMLGGAVPDAMLAAVRTLNSLWDETGAVAVDGLHRHEAPTPEYSEDALRAEAGLPRPVDPIGTGTFLSRMWNQPAITITGVDAPSIANASNTLLPQVAVRLSVRVAPGQGAQEAFDAVAAHLQAHVPFGAQLSISDVDLGQPFLVDTSGPAVHLAKASMTRAYGREALETGVGGSIPFIAQLAEIFPSAEILVTGVEDPHSKAHSPNESLHLRTLRNATLSEALMIASLDDA